MSSTDYMKYKKSMDIIGIVHNHPDADNTPSQGDIDNCNALGILTTYLAIQTWN